MKKFMFSAVALVAFSFAGMANTGGAEKLELLTEFNKVESTPCQDYAWNNVSIELEDAGSMTLSDFLASYSWYLDLCNSTGGSVGNVVIVR